MKIIFLKQSLTIEQVQELRHRFTEMSLSVVISEDHSSVSVNESNNDQVRLVYQIIQEIGGQLL